MVTKKLKFTIITRSELVEIGRKYHIKFGNIKNLMFEKSEIKRFPEKIQMSKTKLSYSHCNGGGGVSVILKLFI